MFALTKTAANDLHQVDRQTSGSSEVNLRLALRWCYAYELRHYVRTSS